MFRNIACFHNKINYNGKFENEKIKNGYRKTPV